MYDKVISSVDYHVPFDQELQEYLPFDERDFVIEAREAFVERKRATEDYKKAQAKIYSSQAVLDKVLTEHFQPASEAAEILSIARSTLSLHLRNGTVPGVRLGNQWYVTRFWIHEELRNRGL